MPVRSEQCTSQASNSYRELYLDQLIPLLNMVVTLNTNETNKFGVRIMAAIAAKFAKLLSSINDVWCFLLKRTQMLL